MKYYVGLDLSLTGAGYVALREDGVKVENYVWGQSLSRDATVQDKIERVVYIASKIIDHVRIPVDGGDEVEVAIENYAFSRRGANVDLGELMGVVKSQLWLAFRLVPTMIPVSTARKNVFGKGNFPKKDVKPTLEGLGFTFIDDNDADAYVIAECLRKTMEG